jgi:1-phosphatidylinositol-3-phosphate 5-kinase
MSSNGTRRWSVSSTVLPAASSSRRGSQASNPAKPVQDKEALTQALDQLHTTASRSAELTAFPPPPSSAVEERGRAGPSGGLGGIYNRIKATVSGSIDADKASSRPGSADSRDASKRPSKLPPLRQPDAPSETLDRSPSNIRSSLVSPSLPTSFLSTGRASTDGLDTTSAEGTVNVSNSLDGNVSESASHADVPQNLSLQLSRQQSRSASTNDGQKPITVARAASSRRSDVKLGSAEEVSDMPSHAVQGALTAISKMRSPSKAFAVTVPAESEASPSTRIRNTSTSANSHRRGDSRSSAVYSDREQERASMLARAADDVSSQVEPVQLPAPKAIQTAAQSPKAYNELSKPVLNIETKPAPKPQNSSFMHQMRRKILSRDFWMRDENAKICFGCGDSFSTFRRKHHCRLCGQIFCSSCTKLVSGKAFGQTSKIRVCKTCETMMNGDDSSDYTDDDDTPLPAQVKQIRFSEVPRPGSDVGSLKQADNDTDGEKPATPSSGSSAFRRSRDGRRKSVQLDRVPTLSRPASSRSLKSITGRPRSSSQKTRRPQTQHMRSLGVPVDSGVPFQQAVNTGDPGASQLPVFHTDSVIDPELAPFMSDDDTSEDETPNIASAFSPEFTDQTVGFPNSIFGALKRARSYGPTRLNTEVNRHTRDGDTDSIDSARPARSRRHIGSRSVSVASFSLQR